MQEDRFPARSTTNSFRGLPLRWRGRQASRSAGIAALVPGAVIVPAPLAGDAGIGNVDPDMNGAVVPGHRRDALARLFKCAGRPAALPAFFGDGSAVTRIDAK